VKLGLLRATEQLLPLIKDEKLRDSIRQDVGTATRAFSSVVVGGGYSTEQFASTRRRQMSLYIRQTPPPRIA
jgi:hypothetical protein